MEATTIIWATDGSDLADRALEFVHDLAQKWTTPPRIVAVHVDQRWTGREMNVSKLAGEEDPETLPAPFSSSRPLLGKKARRHQPGYEPASAAGFRRSRTGRFRLCSRVLA